MTTAEIVKELCRENSISLAKLASAMGQSRQNLYQKLKRNSISAEEMEQISDILGVSYEQSFVMPDGTRIQIK